MPLFSWMQQEQDLTNAALTIRAQTISPNDNGRLLWDAFFPRQDVDSVKLRNITSVDFRPAADRREWGARGRLIPLVTPPMADIEMVPVESYFRIGEREIQELQEQTRGNMEMFRGIVGASIPKRVDSLAAANYRRLEVDAMTAWALGQTTARNPILGTTQTVSYGFSASRYTTAGVAWSTTGYDKLMTWLATAIDLVGPIQGVMLRLATYKAIAATAPNPFTNLAGVVPTRAQVESRIQDELGGPFQFYVNESTVDVFTDGGLTTARTKVWPAQRVAVVPQGERIGDMAFAPVSRAYDVSAQAGDGGEIDVRGMTAFTETGGNGRNLTTECRGNAFPLPNEQNLAVIDAGV